jgi:hypothetical protein
MLNRLLSECDAPGSRDNISAVVVQLPGAKVGPAENGGVDRLREHRNAKSKGNEVADEVTTGPV